MKFLILIHILQPKLFILQLELCNMNPSSRYSGEVDEMVSRELSKFFFYFL